MYENDLKRLHFVVEKIDDLLEYRDRYGSVHALLEDKMGWDAAVFCILQIGETLKNKVSPPFLQQHGSHLPVNEAYWTRNYVAHDYENVDKQIIEAIIREHLPGLREELLALIEKLSGQ